MECRRLASNRAVEREASRRVRQACRDISVAEKHKNIYALRDAEKRWIIAQQDMRGARRERIEALKRVQTRAEEEQAKKGECPCVRFSRL